MARDKIAQGAHGLGMRTDADRLNEHEERLTEVEAKTSDLQETVAKRPKELAEAIWRMEAAEGALMITTLRADKAEARVCELERSP